jgi:Leucine-rich repeat (LRR) protein
MNKGLIFSLCAAVFLAGCADKSTVNNTSNNITENKMQYEENLKNGLKKNEKNTKKEYTEEVFLGKISDIFPDLSMANAIAGILEKNIDDTVTKEKLANITGIFNVPLNDTYSLEGIGYLTGVTGINCCKNNVKEIPAEIGNLTNLEVLDFCKAYSLTTIPPEIGKLKNLKLIRLNLTEVKSLPKEIGELTNLELLFCPGMECIPKEIGHLNNLEVLDINGSNLGESINSITKLTNLRRLNMGNCSIKELPKDIGNLKNLQSLNLFGNDIRKIPAGIGKLIDLYDINTYDNYNLDEDYKKYFPKKYDYEKEIFKGQDCIIKLPEQVKENITKVTYELKEESKEKNYSGDLGGYRKEYSWLLPEYNKYTTITPEKLDNNKLVLKNSLLPKEGAYTFRIVVENKEGCPLYSVYKWFIKVK